jgi:phytoene dehydrogenase-like protein
VGGNFTHPVGTLSFCESLLLFRERPQIEDTLIFYNSRPLYAYQKPPGFIDSSSAAICLPNNFKTDDLPYGMARVTYLGNFECWENAPKNFYLEEKEKVLCHALDLIKKFDPSLSDPVFTDVFTPKTVKRYTGHLGGAVYGSQEKKMDGKTPINGLYLIGTDQGYLGIIGALLSGISIANLYGLIKRGPDGL